MYRTLRRFFFWSIMANVIIETTRRCAACARIRGTRALHDEVLKLFHAAAPLALVAMIILGPFPKSTNEHRLISLITDRFSKITRAIPMRSTTATDVAMAFLVHWIYPYGPPICLLTDDGPQFVAKFVKHVGSALGLKQLLTTANHLQTNGQAEPFIKTLASRLSHYVAEY